MALTYLGVGKPQFTVTDGSSTILATYTLPSPLVNNIVKVTNYKTYMNAAGKMVKKYANSNTERWEITLEYKTQMLSQTDLDTILAIFDYERAGYTITLKARTDNSDITGTAILKEIDEINDMIRTIRDEEAANEEHQEMTNKKVIINVESQTAF